MKLRYMVATFSLLLICGSGCNSSSDSNFRTDANGRSDIGEEEILNTFTAIAQTCAARGIAPSSTASQEDCQASCDCTADAIAELDGKDDAPNVRSACYNACDPNFASTDNDPVSVDDEDDIPNYEDFYLDYVFACDEIANEIVYSDGNFVEECVDTCNCLADHIENTVSETEDDNIRSGCLSNCELSAPRSQRSKLDGMLMWVRGGLQ